MPNDLTWQKLTNPILKAADDRRARLTEQIAQLVPVDEAQLTPDQTLVLADLTNQLRSLNESAADKNRTRRAIEARITAAEDIWPTQQN